MASCSTDPDPRRSTYHGSESFSLNTPTLSQPNLIATSKVPKKSIPDTISELDPFELERRFRLIEDKIQSIIKNIATQHERRELELDLSSDLRKMTASIRKFFFPIKTHRINVTDIELGKLFAILKIEDIFKSLKQLNPDHFFLRSLQELMESNFEFIKRNFVTVDNLPTALAEKVNYGELIIDQASWFDKSTEPTTNTFTFNVIRTIHQLYGKTRKEQIAALTRKYLVTELKFGKDLVLSNDKFLNLDIMYDLFLSLNKLFKSDVVRGNTLRLGPHDKFLEIEAKLSFIYKQVINKLDLLTLIGQRKKRNALPVASSSSSTPIESEIRDSTEFDNLRCELGKQFLRLYPYFPFYLSQEAIENENALIKFMGTLLHPRCKLNRRALSIPTIYLNLFDFKNMKRPLGYATRISSTKLKRIPKPKPESSTGASIPSYIGQFFVDCVRNPVFIKNKLILTTWSPIDIPFNTQLIQQINRDVTGMDSENSPFLRMTRHFHQGIISGISIIFSQIYGISFYAATVNELPFYFQIFENSNRQTIYRVIYVTNMYQNDIETDLIHDLHYHVVICDSRVRSDGENFVSSSYVSEPIIPIEGTLAEQKNDAKVKAMEHLESILRGGVKNLKPWEPFLNYQAPEN